MNYRDFTVACNRLHLDGDAAPGITTEANVTESEGAKKNGRYPAAVSLFAEEI
ncbi:MAG: hypothetical protein MJE12_04980 [Alphaproteobacteria bacterium]|nr:hypothetical protein [Alphaproteobacteria bacterium]